MTSTAYQFSLVFANLQDRAFQTSHPAETATTDSSGCDPGNFFSIGNGTAVSCQNGSNNNAGAAPDFASTTLWVVVIVVVAAVTSFTFAMFLIKRRIWYRNRHRVREALWDMVNGVRDGTVDEAALRRLVDTHLGLGTQPKLYEAHLSFQDSRFNTEDKKSIDQDKKGAITEIPMDAKSLENKPSSIAKNDTPVQWKWTDLRPLSVSQPFPLTDDPKQAYPKLKGKERSSSRLLHLSLSSSSQPSPKGNHAKATSGDSAMTNATEQDTFIKSGMMTTIERGITPVVMIAMPHPDRPIYLQPIRPINLNNTVNLNVGDVPIKLGVISTTVIEDLTDPITPNFVPQIKQKKKSEILAEALSSSNRVGGMAARAEDMTLMAELTEARRREEEVRERQRREERERLRGQWVDDTPDWLGFGDVRRRQQQQNGPTRR